MARISVRIEHDGVWFPASGRGRVFSVHERAVNLEFEGYAELATLVADEQMMTVSSRLIRAEWGALGLAGIERACAFEAGGARIEFSCGSTLILDASRATRFDGRIDPMRAAGTGPPPVDALLAAIARHAPGVGFAPLAAAMRGGPPYPDRLAEADADAFARGAWQLVRPILAGEIEPGRVLEHAFGMVGLGAGFTPSGDDFIVGMLAARTLLGEPGPTGPALARLLDRCAATTRPGATILLQALRGCFPGYLCSFAAGFAAGSPGSHRAGEPLDDAVRHAARHGHSSGIDALTGFALGINSDLTTRQSRFIVTACTGGGNETRHRPQGRLLRLRLFDADQ